MAILLSRFAVLAMMMFITSLSMAQTGQLSGLPSFRGYRTFPKVMGHGDNADWKMTRLRYVSLVDSANQALRMSRDGRELFPYLMGLVLDGKVTAMEYDLADEGIHMGGKADIRKVLGDNGVPFSEKNGKLTVDNMRSVAADIEAYYIIDGKYYDVTLGKVRHGVMALCPVLARYNDREEQMRFPLMWVMARDLEPFINTWFVERGKNEMEYMTLSLWLALDMYRESEAGDEKTGKEN